MSQENALTDGLHWKSSKYAGKGWELESASEMRFRMRSTKYWTTEQYFYHGKIYSEPLPVAWDISNESTAYT